jgi:hypothetical protein
MKISNFVVISLFVLPAACKSRDFNTSETSSTKTPLPPKSYDNAAAINTILSRSKGIAAEIQANALTCGYTRSTVRLVSANGSKYFAKTVYGDRMTTPGETCLLQDLTYSVNVEGAEKAAKECPVNGVKSGNYVLKSDELLVGGVANCDLVSVADVKSVVYVNQEGCNVEKKARGNGYILSIWKNRKSLAEASYSSDYSAASYDYCSDEKTNINFLDGAKGTGVMISCSESQKGNATTRGRVDFSLTKDGDLTEIKVDGQKKGFFGWKQEVKEECLNLSVLNPDK